MIRDSIGLQLKKIFKMFPKYEIENYLHHRFRHKEMERVDKGCQGIWR